MLQTSLKLFCEGDFAQCGTLQPPYVVIYQPTHALAI